MISWIHFFEEKFEFDLHSNLTWSSILEENESKLTDFMSDTISHISNIHHLWNARLIGKKAESNDWDNLPMQYWHRFHQQNYNETIEFLQHQTIGQTIHYFDSEGNQMEKETVAILYHILNHSNYHRAQLAVVAKQLGIPVPSSNFILFR